MGGKRSLKIGLVLVLAMIAMPGATLAWEFSMLGSSTFITQRYSQAGPGGFFGPYDFDASVAAAGAFASANSWLGPQVGNISSGSVATQSSFSTSLFPALRVTPAIALQGVYRIGNSPTEFFPGSTVSFAFGEWLQWWASINSPLGLVAYGKRPFSFGCGLQYDLGNRTQEHLALVSYYGPLTIGLGIYPWRPISEYRDLGELYWNVSDDNGVNRTDFYGFLTYENGPFEAGIMSSWYSYHAGPERGTTTATRLTLAPLDVTLNEGSVYLKYNNGRFFFNAEADWIYRTGRWQKSAAGTFLTADGVVLPEVFNGSDVFRPQYTESWRYMVELGCMCGPTKLSLLTSYVPGPDRRHGALIDRQPVFVDLYRPDTIYFSRDYGNTTVFKPYSLLFSTDYGSGLGATIAAPTSGPVRGRSGDGYVVDARVYAGRLDYAVASNLNIFSTFLYATRVSHGYGWGYITPKTAALDVTITGGVAYLPTGTFAVPSPAIPDDGLGWEVTSGVDWNLLDSWMLNITCAYWQPGKWFNFACIDKAVPGWDTPTVANNFGVSPDRSIDGIFGIMTTLAINF